VREAEAGDLRRARLARRRLAQARLLVEAAQLGTLNACDCWRMSRGMVWRSLPMSKSEPVKARWQPLQPRMRVKRELVKLRAPSA